MDKLGFESRGDQLPLMAANTEAYYLSNVRATKDAVSVLLLLLVVVVVVA